MRYALLIATLLMLMPLAAQPRIACVGMSAALPGSAELALGKYIRGGALLTADLLALFAWNSYRNDARDLTDGYKRYAKNYAGVSIKGSDHYYQHIQMYYSSDEWNQFQEMMARNYYLIYNYDPENYEAYLQANLYQGDETWSWQSPDHYQKYKSIRRERQKAVMYQNLALGVLLLNRAISVVDALFLTRDSGQTSVPVSFSVSPDHGLMVNYSLEF